MTDKNKSYDKIVYLLQGGGALGSYQLGVCEALLEHDYSPDWVVGTSIGAINAAIIAGNKPQNRVTKLNEFWSSITSSFPIFIEVDDNVLLQEFQNYMSAYWIAFFGQDNFFKPWLINPIFFLANTPDKISIYDTSQLRETLEKVIDFKFINQKKVRLTVGAVNIKGGKLVHFDNTHQEIGPEHIMASCALPPGFPAVKIANEYYWDGGLSSNTPFAILLEEKMPKKLLCFIVNLFSYPEHLPSSFMDVLTCKKEIVFASRHHKVLDYFRELHCLQHTIHELPKEVMKDKDIETAMQRIVQSGHPTALNIVRFHYQKMKSDLLSKDYNFSEQAIKAHRNSGYTDAQKAIKKSAWQSSPVGDKGAIIHEF
ncbi:patatin-like phospholipase family protein [Legionella cincinnatiensis]|uniref:Patatin-like phospholipase n=1 Tax=Legionella cincinnatiensis TaxID=28085 RepID=A0A378IKX2_9GAMM|nr:patatin-like phospholipase family protein [Legionella cincinnatiensis]KTC83043.1 patatin-like phospholipase [Legionella cincinnatiensis]STX35918.1 patatin-like phospholipase [Legionella cincinnatiensis]